MGKLESSCRLERCSACHHFKMWDRSDWGDYCGVALLSIPGKVFACILLNRLSTLVEDFQPQAQHGFHANWGITDIIFFSQQMQEKCIEEKMPFFIIFIDFIKAFNTKQGSAMNYSMEIWVPSPYLPCILE